MTNVDQLCAVMEDNNWRHRLVKPLIPGPFVVLQGSAGDGMQNSIDSMPIIPESFQSNNQRQRRSGDTSVSSNEDDRFSSSPLTSDDSDDHEYCGPQRRSRGNSSDSLSSSYVRQFNHVGLADNNEPESPRGEQASSSSSAMLSSLGASSSSSELQRQRRVFTAISRSGRSISISGNIPSSTINGEGENDDDSFLVVDDSSSSTDPNPQAAPRPTRRGRRSREDREVSDSLKRWNAESRENEISLLRELEVQYRMRRPVQQTNTDNARRGQDEYWWQRDGKLAIFSIRPSVDILSGQSISRKLVLVGDLAPGSTVVATDLFYLKCSFTYEFLRIESPMEGYILYSIDGYNFLSSGLPLLYCDPNEWLWRVICPDGAFVRGGLELNSSHITTIPYGAIVKVNRKTVNEMVRLVCKFRFISSC